MVSMNTIDTHLHTSLSLSLVSLVGDIYICIYEWVNCTSSWYVGGVSKRRAVFLCSETRQIGYELPPCVCVCVCVCFGRVFFSGPIFECHLEIESALSLQYERYIHTLNRYDRIDI